MIAMFNLSLRRVSDELNRTPPTVAITPCLGDF